MWWIISYHAKVYERDFTGHVSYSRVIDQIDATDIHPAKWLADQYRELEGLKSSDVGTAYYRGPKAIAYDIIRIYSIIEVPDHILTEDDLEYLT